jgi:hypothetical protein
MRFSEREGFRSIRETLQVNSADVELRNSIWNLIYNNLFSTSSSTSLPLFLSAAWMYYLKRPLDEKPRVPRYAIDEIKTTTLDGQWYEIYDLAEFFIETFPFQDKGRQQSFILACNDMLQREMSAYRIIGTKFTRLTSEQEIAAVEVAQSAPDQFAPAATHFRTALARLSDRTDPDYRNSIKESISAVESACRVVTDKPKATLGDALKQLEAQGIAVHPAIRNAFGNLYGYTSDEGGIRHSLLAESDVDFEDAKFMLVCCSAFVNLLRARSPR